MIPPTQQHIDTWAAKRELKIYGLMILWALLGLRTTRNKQLWT